jgi:hypothetical protein
VFSQSPFHTISLTSHLPPPPPSTSCLGPTGAGQEMANMKEPFPLRTCSVAESETRYTGNHDPMKSHTIVYCMQQGAGLPDQACVRLLRGGDGILEPQLRAGVIKLCVFTVVPEKQSVPCCSSGC